MKIRDRVVHGSPAGDPASPDDAASGQERMTAAQASYLKALAEEAYEPDAFSSNLTRAEAAQRIAVLQAKLKLQDGPPHTL
jgi:hypothetical protein